ncbi:hypothetical protein [Paraburkholderia terricola]|uniref:hypothetical protein n=1 Tax=Paraburkholderia terricola TaxID=169427 RepID=UPI003ECE47BD
MSLVTTLRSELNARKGDWPAVCRQTNLSYWWMTKFAQGRIENPGIRKLETLQAHFEAHPLPENNGSAHLSEFA